MSNILFLTHIYPYPPNDGGRIVTYNTLKVLKERNHNVTLISFINSNKEQRYENLSDNQYLIDKDYTNGKLKLLKNIFSKTPFTMEKYRDIEIESTIKKVLSESVIDYVILDHLHMAYYINLIKKIKPDVKVFLRQHNVEAIIMKRAYQKEKNIFKKLYLYAQFKKLLKYEKSICELMDRVFVITEDDKETLIKMNPSINKVDVVKAGVDFKKYKPFQPHATSNNKDINIVFLGAMNWLPNEHGVTWFAEKVLPQLIEYNKNINLYIVGKDPTKKIYSIQEKFPNNIKVTGYVEDERDYISMSDVFVVPLLIGGGMRLKILNALAMKKAIVTTGIGAEGINLENSYVVADTPKEFFLQIKKLLDNKEYRQVLEQNGYEQVKCHYSFESVLEPLLSELRD
jgi:polysaccharide biosynthesis protein PslH